MRIKMTLATALLVGSTLTAQAQDLSEGAEIVIADAGAACGLICLVPLLVVPFLFGSGGATIASGSGT